MAHRNRRNPDDKPDTALGEVLHEVEEAETRVTDSEEQRRRRGEAGEAITPNEQAQEQSRHD
ncbi:hypothetical protein [Streptomyces adelaidensis]|uniref:hypothetical protein n=1 Tax=Streptomyces adelaidensis TaxID=2796465 RepID=UPI001902C6B4|nr:hypothetical protein [Streptomyces adelaidensis]